MIKWIKEKLKRNYFFFYFSLSTWRWIVLILIRLVFCKISGASRKNGNLLINGSATTLMEIWCFAPCVESIRLEVLKGKIHWQRAPLTFDWRRSESTAIPMLTWRLWGWKKLWRWSQEQARQRKQWKRWMKHPSLEWKSSSGEIQNVIHQTGFS